MKVKILEQTSNTLKFTLEDADPTFSNALRRILVSELPVLAVEDVTFIENDSVFYDEFVAHRIGMLPIQADTKGMTLPNKCTCKGKGCAKCQIKLTLIKKGPCTVYSGDIKAPAKIKIADDKIPVLKLKEGQKIKLEATAVLGVGKDHAKWMPGVTSYSYDEPGKITFTIESHGNLDPKKMVLGSIAVLGSKAKEFAKLLK